MLHLRTLGGAVLAGEMGPLGGTAAQRKTVALLGLLASGDERGVSRDKVMAYLWPEADAEQAGHRLAQLLYAVRRDLALEDLFLGSTELRLNPARIGSDAREFRVARQSGDLERAAALYGGPFLDGFFLSAAPQFERWMENERTGYARDFAEVVEALAQDAGARGDARRAAEWWQRLADHHPLSSRVTVHLMAALAAAGSRAEALDRARCYQELVHRELEAEPNPAILALAEELRKRPGDATVRPDLTATAEMSVAVMPFVMIAVNHENDYFAEGLVAELMSALACVEGLRVASRSSVNSVRVADLDAREIGRRLNVCALLEGTVRRAGGRLRVAAQLVDAGDGCHVWSERFECAIEDVFAAQDELTSHIVRGVQSQLPRLRSSARVKP